MRTVIDTVSHSHSIRKTQFYTEMKITLEKRYSDRKRRFPAVSCEAYVRIRYNYDRIRAVFCRAIDQLFSLLSLFSPFHVKSNKDRYNVQIFY